MDLALLGRAAAALGVIAVILAGLKFAVRARFHSNGRLLRVLETVFLPGAASLHVVDVAGRYYVVGRGGAEVALLCEIPAEALEKR
jgi:flagellar biogenesis protein FliO